MKMKKESLVEFVIYDYNLKIKKQQTPGGMNFLNNYI